MKKSVFALAIICFMTLTAQADVAKYCMSYSDFVAGNWKSVDELTEGRTRQACQIKSGDHCVYFKTGDKLCDQILKKQVFAVMYGNQLFVNCRNLRYNDVSLETSRFVQAIRYDNNKLCLIAYKTNTLTALAEIGTSIAGCFVNNGWVRLGLFASSAGFSIANDSLSDLVCYLIDSAANAKGKTAITRINDEFMEHLLGDDANLLDKYMAVKTKRNRQSAANVLPILMEKGLVASAM